MFREIRTREKLYNKKEEKGYTKIKPETNITVKEAEETIMQIWQDMINQAEEG